jgi:hypothetical protein
LSKIGLEALGTVVAIALGGIVLSRAHATAVHAGPLSVMAGPNRARMLLASACLDHDDDDDCDINKPSKRHEVVGLATDVTPVVNVRSNARFGHLLGGWTYTDNGKTFHVKATCLQIVRNHLLGSPKRTLPGGSPAQPYFDALITGVTADHAQHEHTVLEVLDGDGNGRELLGRQSWQYGSGVAIHQGSSGRCWLPYLLPVPASPDRVEVR